MIWVLRIHMSLRKPPAFVSLLRCFSLLLLLLSSSCSANGSPRSGRLRTGSVPQPNNAKSKPGFVANKDQEEGSSSADFADEKRKVYTGPNPLHN